MRAGMIGIALLGVLLAAPASAQTSYSSSTAGTVVAATTLPSVSTLPLYFRVIAANMRSGEMNGISAGNGILYQITGTTELFIDGKMTTLRADEGIFIPGGSQLLLKARDGEPSIFLHFLLSPGSFLDQVDALNGAVVREIYRSASPITGLKEGRYVLSLSRVSVPSQAPFDPPHHRSGAALHYVLSGAGAETADGITVAKWAGSISYERSGLVYQWGNPGNAPLTYLVFNLNSESEDPVLADAVPDNRRR